LVAVASGVLEVEGVRGPRHLLAQPAGEQVGAALHEEADLSNPAAVLLAADPAFARPGAAPDVKVEAHLALLEDVLRAGPEGQELAQALDSAAQALRARVRPEVERPVVQDAARVVDARELLGHGQLQVEVVLVVLEPDVEPG